jgi:hypothetical protein
MVFDQKTRNRHLGQYFFLDIDYIVLESLFNFTLESRGLYYKTIMIVNDDRKLTPQFGASLMVVTDNTS